MTKIKKCKFTKIKMNKKVASIKTKKARANRDKMKKKTEGNQNLKNIANWSTKKHQWKAKEPRDSALTCRE